RLTTSMRTALHTLSLHDALPICNSQILGPAEKLQATCAHFLPIGLLCGRELGFCFTASHELKFLQALELMARGKAETQFSAAEQDRKSTRLNSSHDQISYAVFCL